jgi:N-dimethylarginine dimethylaminohydrolase
MRTDRNHAEYADTEMTEVSAQLFGGQTMVERLRRVLVRPPDPESLSRCSQFGWRAPPDPARLLAEHDQFCSTLTEFGAEVVVGRSPVGGNPDAIYAHDTSLISDEGAVVLRPGKALRRDEVPAAAADLQAAGVPIIGVLEEPACAEGGDIVWLDEETVLVGWTYRTNGAGIEALKQALPDVDVVALDLPHFRGAGAVLHLMSVISMLDRDLALVYLPLAPVRLLELLSERGIRPIEVPDEEFDTLGPNVLALAPRVALAAAGNPQTRRRMEREGVDVAVYQSAELVKGDGGPTCLTRPVLRSP